MNIKLKDILVCEDIRNEIGGQHTIIGLVNEVNANISNDFKGDINLPFSFLIRLSNNEKKLKLKEIQIVMLNDKKNEMLSRKISVKENQPQSRFFNIALVKEVVSLKETTHVSFKIILKDEQGKEKIILSDNIFKINIIRDK